MKGFIGTLLMLAASSSGAANVVSNASVSATGSSSASAQVYTVVNGNGGSTTVHVETSDNGAVHRETFTQPAGVPVSVEVVASSTGYRVSTGTPATVASTGHAPGTASTSIWRPLFIPAVFGSWLDHLLHWFGW